MSSYIQNKLEYIIDFGGGVDKRIFFRNWESGDKTVEASENENGPWNTYYLYELWNEAEEMAEDEGMDITEIAEIWRGVAYRADTTRRNPDSSAPNIIGLLAGGAILGWFLKDRLD